MISAWHLLWIVPLTVFATIFCIAMAQAASDSDEGRK